MKEPLIFDIALGRTKPENIRNTEAPCPFCDTKNLTNILDRQDSLIWLMNKYPVLQNTWPTVIIESDDCHGEFSVFSLDEAEKILTFSLEKWEETKARPEFKSVIFFKNFGPMSGGSLRHPHSQIIGLYDYDYREDMTPRNFEGWLLHEEKGLQMTLSRHPLIGFFEFNIIFEKQVQPRRLALRLQQLLRYLKENFARYSFSYNVFFYDLHTDHYYLKVVPRYLISPLYVGYQISQVCNDARAELIHREIQPFLRVK